MRPVDKGEHPVQPETGMPVVFREYGDARDYLIERLGDYCSYCELPCQEGPAIEHVRPKSRKKQLKKSWINFLLGCRYCNSCKGDADVVLSECFWPDADNTWECFSYEFDMPPQPRPGLSAVARNKAEKTLDLTGLDRIPGHPKLTPKDVRWKKRRNAWVLARRASDRLQKAASDQLDTSDLRDQIVETAQKTGFWSVWMTVFQDDAEMVQELIAAFPGTNQAFF